MNPKGRPTGECRSAQHEGRPASARDTRPAPRWPQRLGPRIGGARFARKPTRGRARDRNRRPCRGIVLLEALIAVLVLSLGTLALLGLATRALHDAGNAHWRGEAANLAESTLARMWTENPATLADRYDSAAGGPGFLDIVAAAAKLPGVTPTRNVPVVSVANAAAGASPRVTLTLFWQSPDDALPHRYATEQVIASR